ncbi:MAG TPA: UbiA family prenyltransferase [Candidatus Latescibacteria bacterium]|jgi:hypothetical protein|nr:UbiA family prenyltransferase [Candidatus Latescibacterota bacterium]HJP29092.1 UbiA family prenyltransferase [Candidatus Latescibacterota bacterium]
MRSGFRRGLEWILLDTHIWVSAAAAGLTLFAASALGLPQRLAPMGAVFSATMLIYAVDDIFDGRMRSQPGRWLTVLLGAGSLSGQLLLAPVVITVTVTVGAIPALLYGVPIRGRRLRELPAVKPFFVAGSLTVAAIVIPVLWAWSQGGPVPPASTMMMIGSILLVLVLCNVCFFDLRDRVADDRDGIRTIPVCLGMSGTRSLCLWLALGVALLTLSSGDPWRGPAIAAALATAAYCRLLQTPGRRLETALVVDGVPVLLGVMVLAVRGGSG